MSMGSVARLIESTRIMGAVRAAAQVAAGDVDDEGLSGWRRGDRRMMSPMICQKCRYVRQASDSAPMWQCPSCEVAYIKAGDPQPLVGPRVGAASRGFVPNPERGWPWGKLALAGIAFAAAAWQGGLLADRGSAVAGHPPVVHANGQPEVFVYSAEWCGSCRSVKAFLEAGGILYTEMDIDKSAQARENFHRLGGGGIPLVFVGEEQMRGFSPDWLRDRLGRWMKG
jgi:glutaredoxin/predicted Zn-ribbon and HTH transcriptional regulator